MPPLIQGGDIHNALDRSHLEKNGYSTMSRQREKGKCSVIPMKWKGKRNLYKQKEENYLEKEEEYHKIG